MTINSSQITRLVFSGGGARGAVYPGAYAALKETSIFDGVEDLAGSSAGAFTATLLALGISTQTFQYTLVNMNFTDLLGSPHENAWITKDAKPLYDLIRNTIQAITIDYLTAQLLDDTHPCKRLLDDLKDHDHGLTFADLHTLSTYWPKQYRHLTITAVKENGGHLKIFNHHDTPNVEIALACKASGAIPVVLKSVEIDGESYVDGGLYDNIPTDFFDKCSPTSTASLPDSAVDETTKTESSMMYENNKYPTQTLVFSFLEGHKNENLTLFQTVLNYFLGKSSLFHALHGSRADEHNNRELFKKLLHWVEDELDKKITSDAQNTPIQILIDSAVDKVAADYKWSWFRYVWTVIVATFVAIWSYICAIFWGASSVSSSDIQLSLQEQSDTKTYLNIIRDALKETTSRLDSLNAWELCQDVKKTTPHHQIHKAGPHKPPVLFDRNWIELMAYNYVPKCMGSFTSNYHTTDKIEEGFQRLRLHYPLRTVALGIGYLSPIDFDAATSQSRFLSARGYLDTMNTLLNLYLYDKSFDPNAFYSDIITPFKEIYQEAIITSNQSVDDDKLLQALSNPNGNLSLQAQFHLIKEEAEFDPTSSFAFALTRAVELRRQEISWDSIFEEIDARFQVEVVNQVEAVKEEKLSPTQMSPAPC